MFALRPGRRLFVILAGVFSIAAIISGWQWRRYEADYQTWRDYRPCEIAIDLSRPGETTAPFRQTCGTACAESLMLQVADHAGDGQLASEWLGDLLASATVNDAYGQELAAGVIDREGIWRPVDAGPLELGTLPAFPTGSHTLTVRVHRGAKRLAGTEQRLYARYVLCGWERRPAMMAMFTTAVLIVFAVCSLWLAMRRQRR